VTIHCNVLKNPELVPNRKLINLFSHIFFLGTTLILSPHWHLRLPSS